MLTLSFLFFDVEQRYLDSGRIQVPRYTMITALSNPAHLLQYVALWLDAGTPGSAAITIHSEVEGCHFTMNG
jgi:hypothetical protein